MDGMWENNKDGMKLVGDSGKIVLNFNAKQVNIVADGNAILKIEYDGGIIPIDSRGYDINSNGEVIISEPRLYNLIELDQEGPHEIIIKVAEPRLLLDKIVNSKHDYLRKIDPFRSIFFSRSIKCQIF
jgi:hypothetical protein